MKTLLRTLTQISAPSGREDEIRTAVLQMIQPYADEVRVDALGNLIARKGKQAKNGRRIMLAAHMDGIGVIVSHVDAGGFVRFSALGGLSPHRRLGARVKFLNGARGVIALEREAEFKERAPSLDRYYIDMGAAGGRDCPVKVGDAAVFDTEFQDLGKRVVAPALDDRAGVALLVESLTRFQSDVNEVWYVFTVQEEVGTRGAGPASYGIHPDVGIAVDVTIANDAPNARERNPILLGGGPAIKVKDAGVISDPRIVQEMTRLAERNRIPHQFEILEMGGTDAGKMQVTGLGAQAGGIAIPLRHIHSPSEMVDLDDLKNAGKLLAAFLRR